MNTSLESRKYDLSDFLQKNLNKYTKIISDDLKKSSVYVKPNDIFIVTKLTDHSILNAKVTHKEVMDKTGKKVETKHTFAKVKEGPGEFGGVMDYPGTDRNSVKIAIDYAEKSGRKYLTDYIGGKNSLEEIPLSNDDYDFDVNLECEVESDYDIRNADVSELNKELMSLAQRIKKKGNGRIKRVYAGLRSELEMNLIANSAGGLTFQKIPRTGLNFTTIAYPERVVDPYGFVGKKNFHIGATAGLDLFHDLLDGKHGDLSVFLDEVADDSIDFFYNSIPIERTGYKTHKPITALLSPGQSGTMVHEALGHHVEQDLEDEFYGARFLRDHIGDKVARDDLTIFFDPQFQDGLDYRPFGTYFYDDEGMKGKRAMIIKNGIATDTLTDLCSAKIYGVEPNGHSKMDYIRMSNLVIDDKGGAPPRELLQEISGKGYYIKGLKGGYTQEVGKQGRLFVDSLYFVDDDCELVPIATLTPAASRKRKGNARVDYNLSIDSFDVLENVKAIGKNTPLKSNGFNLNINTASHCGKGGESTPSSQGGAYLLMDNLLLTKNELEAPRKNLFL